MDVVIHQAPGEDAQGVPVGIRTEPGDVDVAVLWCKEDALAAIASMGNVMRAIRNRDTGKSSHRDILEDYLAYVKK